jgi:protein Tex
VAAALAPASEAGEAAAAEIPVSPEATAPTTEAVPAVAKRAPSPAPLAARVEAKLTIKQLAAKSRKEAKQRKREKKIESFKDYFRHQEPLAKIPPHRALAINRGERSKILRVKIEADMGALYQRAEHRLIRADHPHAEFLRDCLRDALSRLLMPSLEREVRRELTEWAELHAVQVFARNLRQLLLQPPVRDRRVLAIDPGFRSGCKLAAMDEFGNVLGHTVIHVIGKDDIVRRGRQQVVEMVLMYHIPVIAIGNGTACRETERLVADIIAHELKDYDVQYAIVNEAGASVYSTSSVGREELPRFDPVLRSAVSIGRRLQDPLSELVKINPANIGVGLYQHDVKSKHLEESLDAVVESCVNFVGVDANTASPALLRYVSGLNQLTARRMYEYRQKHGPFRSRDQFRHVPGFGDAAFVQSAGFLKIIGGDNPLDATWIHPESYEIAQRVIESLGGSEAELASQLSSRGKIAEVTRPEFGAGVGHVQPEEAAEIAEVAEATTNLSAQPAEDAALQAAPREAAAEPVAETPDAEAVAEPAIVEPAAEPSAEPEASPTPVAAIELVAAEEPASASMEPAAPDVDSPSAPVDEVAVAEPVEAERGDEASAAEPNAQPSLAQRAAQANAAQLARDLGVGELLLRDILNSLKRPGRDPREDLPQPAFRREIMKLEHLQPGMELTGTVLNVVDFGAFVDIGLPDSGLIHISRLADRFVKDPHEIVSVGDILNVWVVEVDRQRRRVSLTAIKPGTERPPQERKEREPPAGRPEGRREGRSEGRGEGRSGRPPQGRRPEGRQPYGQRGGGGGGGRPRVTEVRPSKPKPVTPITDAMAEGKEPMRSFSDLLQFYGRKPEDEEEKKKKK